MNVYMISENNNKFFEAPISQKGFDSIEQLTEIFDQLKFEASPVNMDVFMDMIDKTQAFIKRGLLLCLSAPQGNEYFLKKRQQLEGLKEDLQSRIQACSQVSVLESFERLDDPDQPDSCEGDSIAPFLEIISEIQTVYREIIDVTGQGADKKYSPTTEMEEEGNPQTKDENIEF